MRLLIAPDKFKGTLTQRQAVAAIRRGAERAARERGVTLEIDECPVADGGEGTLEAIAAHTPVDWHRTNVLSLDQARSVRARWCSWTNEDHELLAAIESAEVLGLWLNEDRDPERTTSFGLGQLLSHAQARAYKVFIGLGGTGTVDGGIGVAQTCYWCVECDPPKHATKRPAYAPQRSWESIMSEFIRGELLTGRDLLSLRMIAEPMANRSSHVELIALCDVSNPLLGPSGAARVFGPQKGATPEQVERLEAGLENLVRVCRDCNIPCDPDAPGAGAAGGLGFGLATFLGAKLVPGAPYILDLLKFDQRAAAADLIITGEGKMDLQTASGKACAAVAQAAQHAGKPCIALVGTTEGDPEELRQRLAAKGVRFAAIFPLQTPSRIAADHSQAAEQLEELAYRVILDAPA